MALRIQVLGRGLIPFGLGLAPHKQFFWADKLLIQTILSDSRLSVNMQHPDDGRIIKVTRQNLEKLWNSYSDKYNTPVTTKITSEVIKKPETLIDRNNKKVPKEPLKLNDPKDDTQIIEKNNVASDKQFESVVNKAIEESVKNEVKKEEKKEEKKNEVIISNNQNKNNNQKKEEKKEEKKNEVVLHPINNPESK